MSLVLAFRLVDLMGVLLNGVIGGTIARQRRFDIVGFSVLAIISALGGGILRDVMIQDGRPVALTDRWYLLCALAGAVIAWVVPLRGRTWDTVLPFADGLVLGAWAATGTTKALSAGLGWLPSLLMGIITAVGGGMIRDIAVGNVPAVFGGNRLYATPAMISATGVLLANLAGLSLGSQMIIGAVLGLALTTLAHFFDWRLPQHGDRPVTLTRGQLATLLSRAERRGRRVGERQEADRQEAGRRRDQR